jgi:hypothetical protein
MQKIQMELQFGDIENAKKVECNYIKALVLLCMAAATQQQCQKRDNISFLHIRSKIRGTLWDSEIRIKEGQFVAGWF